jgi:site-specific DNA-cytosine methylase
MSKVTVSTFLPLIGPWEFAVKKLQEEGEDIEHTDVYSFPAFYNPNEKNYELNHNKKIHQLPIELVKPFYGEEEWRTIEHYKKYIQEHNIKSTDILAAVPVCSALSRLNVNSSSNYLSANWIYEVIKFFLAKQDHVMILENAPGLAHKEGKKVLRKIKEILHYNKCDNYYKVHLIATSTLYHRIPQHRTRCFLAIYKNEYFKMIKHKDYEKYLGFSDYLSQFKKETELSKVPTGDGSKYYRDMYDLIKQENLKEHILKDIEEKDQHCTTIMPYLINLYKENKENIREKSEYFADSCDKKIKKLDAGLGYFDISIVIVNKKKYICALISKNCGAILHPSEDRFLNVKELAMLMGYPEDFKLDNPTKEVNVIFQSVPITTARDMLKFSINFLGNDDSYIENEISLEGNPIILQKIKQDKIRNFYLDDNNNWLEISKGHSFKPIINI